MDRSFAFDHVACGVHALAAIAPLLELGLGARTHRGGPNEAFRGAQWAFAGEGRLELIEPAGEPGGFLHRFLAAGGPRVHHVTFKVPDICAVRDRATALGYDVVGFNDSTASWKECFLHPKQAGGIVVQMAESHPGLADDNWKDLPRFTSGDSERTVTLLGLRVVARDADRARRCWGDLLGGAVETTTHPGSGLRVDTWQWPDSPLRLRVFVDPDAALEGPSGLEFERFGTGSPDGQPAAEDFPDGLSALLGTRLLQV